jgi:hypothetical protein
MFTNHVYLSAEVKHDWSYTRTHIIYLNGLDRGNFTFFLRIVLILVLLSLFLGKLLIS